MFCKAPEFIAASQTDGGEGFPRREESDVAGQRGVGGHENEEGKHLGVDGRKGRTEIKEGGHRRCRETRTLSLA